jgi:hypothetical protein
LKWVQPLSDPGSRRLAPGVSILFALTPGADPDFLYGMAAGQVFGGIAKFATGGTIIAGSAAGGLGGSLPTFGASAIAGIAGVSTGYVFAASGAADISFGLAFAMSVHENGGGGGPKGAAKPGGAPPNSSGVNTGRWHQGSFSSPEASLQAHFQKHGAAVGARDAAQYLRKAEGFAQNLRGAERFPVDGFTEGVVRYVKNGRYIDLAADGRIVSFGAR